MISTTRSTAPFGTHYLSRSLPEQRHCLYAQFTACRASTLKRLEGITPDEYYRQAHPDFSPVGWHLGHIAFTEALWILEHLAGQDAPLPPPIRRLFAADGLPKAERERLPDLPAVLDLLAKVRDRVWDYLEKAPLAEQDRLWWWLLQHESQHVETISMVLALHRRNSTGAWQPDQTSPAPLATPDRVYFPATEMPLGYDGIDAIDNEQPVQPVKVKAFWLEAIPVTNGQYRQFMLAGGYKNSQWWTPEGWRWLQQNRLDCPLYWPQDTTWDTHPVCGVSGYEADAYARFVGKRLPTEIEWERAATWNSNTLEKSLYPWGNTWPDASLCNHQLQHGSTTAVGTYSPTPSGCYDLMGNVWEWTDAWFDAYPGFAAFPYRGYSQVYFDRQHRVLRGGSWATFPWALRGTLRNWYHPHVRQVFAGFRCAQSAE